jgi:peptide-methionine (S)-S-oxide reductase
MTRQMLPRGHPSRTRAGSTATITQPAAAAAAAVPAPLLRLLLLAAAPAVAAAQLDVNAMLAALSGNAPPPPPPTQLKEAPAVSGVASFGLGCFWGGQIAFGCAEDIVSTTIVGYMGGEPASANYAPTYGDYAEHGYTETVELVYDAEQGDAAYEQLLAVFWASHNPTSPIEGTAYRSVIFVHNEQQERLALRSIAARNQELVGEYPHPPAEICAPSVLLLSASCADVGVRAVSQRRTFAAGAAGSLPWSRATSMAALCSRRSRRRTASPSGPPRNTTRTGTQSLGRRATARATLGCRGRGRNRRCVLAPRRGLLVARLQAPGTEGRAQHRDV